jgi:hypothetical protein
MNTSTMTEREALIQIYSDFHKDAYGFRPRYNYPEFTLEELKADFDRFEAVCKENAEHEAKAEREAIAKFNASIEKLISIGARTKAGALRWMADAGVAEDGWDMDYHLWKLGISKYSAEGKVIHDKLLPYWRKAVQHAA